MFPPPQTGGSRVLAHNPLTGMLVASKPSNNQLVPGYGVLKVNIRAGAREGVH